MIISILEVKGCGEEDRMATKSTKDDVHGRTSAAVGRMPITATEVMSVI